MKTAPTASTPPDIAYRAVFLTLIGYGLYVSCVASLTIYSSDLYALWLAAEFMQMGQLDQIYPENTPLFEMRTPAAWWDHAEPQRDTWPDLRIYPYIYPPIWAKLLSGLTPWMRFETFNVLVLILHQSMMLGICLLAGRMVGLSGLFLWGWTAVTYTGMTQSLLVLLALMENQPQITVSFLIVLAFERVQAGRHRLSGAILAVAAAIKLYPLLFIVIFAARKQGMALLSFVVFGGALGVLSILLAGWPLHHTYLELISTMTRSVIVANTSISLDALIGGLVQPTPPVLVTSPWGSAWYAVAKTPVWAAVSGVATVGALGAISWAAARWPQEALIVPVAAMALALLSPLSWSYTYLTAFVFIGALPMRLGKLGWAAIAILFILTFRTIPWPILGTVGGGLLISWAVTNLLVIGLFILFIWALLRGPVSPQSPENTR